MSSIPCPGREELIKEKGQLKEFLRNKPNMSCDKDNKQIIFKKSLISNIYNSGEKMKYWGGGNNGEIHLLCCITAGLKVISAKHRKEQRFAKI